MPSKSFEKILETTREIYKISTPSDCFFEFIENQIVLQSFWFQVDLDKNDRLKFQKNFIFNIDPEDSQTKLLHVSNPQPIRSDIWSVKSPDGLINALITSFKENGEESQFLELWKDGTRFKNLNLTKLKKHSKIYENSSSFGSFAWSSDSKKIAYIAESKNTNTEKSFFSAKMANDQESMNGENYEQKYGNYHRDEWGEQYVGKAQSIIAVYDLDSDDVHILDNVPKGFAPGKLTWHSNEAVVFHAYYTSPYRLGLIYCPIRKSELFYYDICENKCVQLTNYQTENVRSPQFSNDFENLIWLQNQARGPHFQCSKLMMMNWKTKTTTTLVDIVDESNSKFTGIFSISLSDKCWSLDNKRVILNTQFNGRNRIVSIDIESKTVVNLDSGIDKTHSLSFLKMEKDWICAVLQTYTKAPCLVLAKFPAKNCEKEIKWNLTKSSKNFDDLASVEILDFSPKIAHPEYPNLNFQSIFVQAKKGNDVLVVFPHGGPHSAYGCEYSPHVATMFSLGFSVLLINYRGSSGFGQNSIDSLPGKIGTNDVDDCQQAAEFVFSKYNFKHAVLYGGSHGGYLTTQLIGQFPEFYSAAAARNPVTNLESMLYVTDIPDWVIVEGLGEYDYNFKIGNSNIPKELYQKSPISHVNKVKTPTLLMMGNVDLRVPCSQSIEFYKALKSRNVPVELLSFKEDNHPLEKPQTTADCIVHTLLWYEKYTI
ncbi:acylamino-acid-releasing enzyme-like [Brachionus plicatilis]|uniref:acylaminoacyl-peptidase n=1 Tax=Brachionus plicatilis TaxID=10195 RepID=A0A3M7Q632_BRAPC|nr:acylamino-acid-releasing enzyme-like [Brachionus plicatilis]